jgi:hypothetical protein
MDDRIKSWLEDTDGDKYKKLLESSRNMLKMSKDAMSSQYAGWDAIDEAFRLKRMPDKQDHAAAKRNEPMKLAVPYTYPQVMTFVAYLMLLYYQRDSFYEVTGTGPEDTGSPEKDATACLDRDTKKNKWHSIVYQVALDIGRFGLGIIKTSWEERTANVMQQQPKPAGTTSQGVRIAPTTELVKKKAVVYQGNKASSVSPYHFFPDTRLPLTRFQEGEFCASEDEYSMTRLRQLEADGIVTNVDKIKSLGGLDGMLSGMLEMTRMGGFNSNTDTMSPLVDRSQSEGMVVLSEIQRWITPSKFVIGPNDDDVLDKSRTTPELWVIWLGNWDTVLRFEAMDYPHNEFTYDVGQFSADQHQTINEGLGALLGPIQDVAAFMLNSRITSIRKMIDNKLIVNTQFIETKDLESRSPIIRTKAGMTLGSVDQYVHQLKLQDVTTGHVTLDMPMLWQMAKDATGIGDNVLGSYSTGRRDATQARAVNAGAASRLKTVALVIWETLLEPCGQKMLCNLQAGLSIEEFRKIVGDDADDARFAAFNKREQGILNAYDFNLFDGTSPTEKGYIAQSMQELLLGMWENPMAMQMLQYPPFRALLTEICNLRGVKHPERFLPEAPNPNAIQFNPAANPGAGTAQPAVPVAGVPQ